jgi:hypothetical protein
MTLRMLMKKLIDQKINLDSQVVLSIDPCVLVAKRKESYAALVYSDFRDYKKVVVISG